MFNIIRVVNGRIRNYLIDERSKNIAKSVVGISLLKGSSILLNILILPLTIKFITPVVFGIWVTLSSMLLWVSFFDIGFANGLRNKLTEALSNKDILRAKELVSTTYLSLFVVFSFVFLVLCCVNYFLNWGDLIQIPSDQVDGVKTLMFLLIGFFCLQFILRIITTICLANQNPFTASLIDFIGQVLGFIVILFGLYGGLFSGTLINLGLVFTLSPLAVLLFSNFALLKSKYKLISPNLKYFRKSALSEILGLGSKFFVIQIAGLIQYQTANFLIARNYPLVHVAAYNVAFKYFLVLNMLFNLLLTPQWSAVTEAFAKQDFNWIKKTVKLYRRIAIVFALIGVGMFFASDFVYKFWLGDAYFEISKSISFWTAIFFITANFSGLYVSVLNGIGVVKLQYYLCYLTPIVFLFTYYVFHDILHVGISSVLIASILSNISGLLVAPIQYHKFMSGKRGIWGH